MLLAFILLGIFFGSDGVVKIEFGNYDFAEQICSAALIFIMFYGGFGTKWSEARPVAVKACFIVFARCCSDRCYNRSVLSLLSKN